MCQFVTVLYLRGRRVRTCSAVVPTGREPVAQRDDSAWTTTAECLKAPVFLAISKVHGERTEILSSSLCCYKKHLDCQIQFQSLPIWRGSRGSVAVPTLHVLYLCPTPSSCTLLKGRGVTSSKRALSTTSSYSVSTCVFLSHDFGQPPCPIVMIFCVIVP